MGQGNVGFITQEGWGTIVLHGNPPTFCEVDYGHSWEKGFENLSFHEKIKQGLLHEVSILSMQCHPIWESMRAIYKERATKIEGEGKLACHTIYTCYVYPTLN